MRLFKKIETGLYAYINYFLLKKVPVLVYAPGRVGSISMIYAIRKAGVFSFKIERLEKEHLGSVRFCLKNIIKPKNPAKIITLVRDPVEILCSLFFSFSARGFLSMGQTAIEEKNMDNLLAAFQKEILEGKILLEYLYWYETEFNKQLHFDIFDYPFNKNKKYDVVEHPLYPTLILRTDLPDEIKEKQVKSFLNINNFHIHPLNVKSERKDGELYIEFKNNLKLTEEVINTIYNSPYAQHFFTDTEITELKLKWSH